MTPPSTDTSYQLYNSRFRIFRVDDYTERSWKGSTRMLVDVRGTIISLLYHPVLWLVARQWRRQGRAGSLASKKPRWTRSQDQPAAGRPALDAE